MIARLGAGRVGWGGAAPVDGGAVDDGAPIASAAPVELEATRDEVEARGEARAAWPGEGRSRWAPPSPLPRLPADVEAALRVDIAVGVARLIVG